MFDCSRQLSQPNLEVEDPMPTVRSVSCSCPELEAPTAGTKALADASRSVCAVCSAALASAYIPATATAVQRRPEPGAAEQLVVQVQASDDLFALFTVWEQVDLQRLQELLRAVRDPAHLADDPAADAQEWLRLDELDARRPPFVPQRVWAWFGDEHPSGHPNGGGHE